MNKLDNSRVLVVLGDKEMTDFALDFQALGLSDPHSRKILLRLTQLACRKSGIDTRGRQIHIEALQIGEGCYLLVTVKRKAQRYTRRRGEEVCCEFESCTDFLNAVEALYRLRFYIANTAAFEWNGRYYLVFGYPALPLSLRRVLGEYAAKRGGALLSAKVRECGRELCRRNAVAVIGAYLV